MSGYLVDTNVLSELVKPRPESGVLKWFSVTGNEDVFVSVLTVSEMRRGALMAPNPVRRAHLNRWIDTNVLKEFMGRVLSVDAPVAERWAHLSAAARLRGRLLPVVDALLAATALEHNLSLVTRNTRDLETTGVPLINPWAERR